MNFDTSEENQLSHFQNGYFFKTLWSFHEPQNQVKCGLENKMHFLKFNQFKMMKQIVSFKSKWSIGMYVRSGK